MGSRALMRTESRVQHSPGTVKYRGGLLRYTGENLAERNVTLGTAAGQGIIRGAGLNRLYGLYRLVQG